MYRTQLCVPSLRSAPTSRVYACSNASSSLTRKCPVNLVSSPLDVQDMRVHWPVLPSASQPRPRELSRRYGSDDEIYRVRQDSRQTVPDAWKLIRFREGCKKLEELNVSWCSNLSDLSINYIANGCPKLQALVCKGLQGVCIVNYEVKASTSANLVVHQLFRECKQQPLPRTAQAQPAFVPCMLNGVSNVQ